MMLRASRERKDDPFVYTKIMLFVVGASLGMSGMALDLDWLVILGIVVLAIAVIIRLASDRRRRLQEEEVEVEEQQQQEQ